MPSMVAIGVRQRVVAFEAPQREVHALQQLRRIATRALAAAPSSSSRDTIKRSWTRGAVWIHEPHVFALVTFLLSPEGALAHPRDHAMLVNATARAVLAPHNTTSSNTTVAASDLHTFRPLASFNDDALSTCTVATTTGAATSKSPHALLVLVVYRPEPLLALCWRSARRAVRFVNAVVSLVTANAYISTLGGGHFLCRHLNQAKVLAKLQIAVSLGLQDPVLESKCRINLAYGALQAGRFRRARRIIARERVVATELGNDELLKICHAADVYLLKTYRLHCEHLRAASEPGYNDRLFDNFYRQRIVRAAK